MVSSYYISDYPGQLLRAQLSGSFVIKDGKHVMSLLTEVRRRVHVLITITCIFKVYYFF